MNAEQMLEALIGQLVLRARLAYADELVVHLGDKLYRASPRAKQWRGAWSLWGRASPWRLTCGGEQFFTSQDRWLTAEERARAEELLGRLVGAKPASIRLLGTAGEGERLLAVTFDTDAELAVHCQLMEENEREPYLSDFELLGPDGACLKYGPWHRRQIVRPGEVG